MHTHEIPRMRRRDAGTSPVAGRVVWSPVKSAWFTAHALVAIVGGCLTFRWDAAVASAAFTVATLCLGHSIGLHRLLIHRSFACPRWLEHSLVHLGTLVGMGGPFRMIYLHEIRDWAQRHPTCHAFFIHQNPLWRDFLWQLHCDIRLARPPVFLIEPDVANNRIHRFTEAAWMLLQIPWALLLFTIGGAAWVVWGVSVRIVVSLIGHWLVGYFAHNRGGRDWHLEGHAVQGHNVPFISLLTMGESWHNNHHAFPGSARLGLRDEQYDPGWWTLRLLRRVGLVWNVRLPPDLPARPELHALAPTK